MLFVKKYGGSSVSTPEKILKIAHHLKKLSSEGHKLIVIVSAMGDTTDDLVQLSRHITHTPVQREMDMLLSSGERISMALMAMALNSLGCPAISFTGSQSGVFTDGSHNNARIKSIKPIRVQAELDKGKVVIIAGFQGVNPETKEVTTLGRGGSDTTAVALANHFKADRCDILTDVRGIFSVDPRVPEVTPHPFPHLNYNQTLEMAYWGARVLHYRSVELAERSQVPLLVHLSSEEGSGTLIGAMEEVAIKALNFNDNVARIQFRQHTHVNELLKDLRKSLSALQLPLPQILCERPLQHGREIFVSMPRENIEGLQKSLIDIAEVESHWGTVTLTGRGFTNSEALFDVSGVLSENNIEVEGVITSPLSLTFIVHQNQIQRATQALHNKFVP